ncbi:hypothetical protein J3E69DRAFT_336414, partial [Trichoderma sp. SZMC 28015]
MQHENRKHGPLPRDPHEPCPVHVRAWIQLLLASSAKPLVTASSIKLDPSTLFSHGLAAFWQLATMQTQDEARSATTLFRFLLAWHFSLVKYMGVLHDAITISSSLFCRRDLRSSSSPPSLSSRSFSHHGVVAVCACAFFGSRFLIVRPRSFDWLPTA